MLQDEVKVRRGQFVLAVEKQLIRTNELFTSPVVVDAIAPSLANDIHGKSFVFYFRKHDSLSHTSFEKRSQFELQTAAYFVEQFEYKNVK